MRRVLIILFILLFIPFKANALDFNSEAADGDKIYICLLSGVKRHRTDPLRHTVGAHHLACNRSGALDVVGSAGGDVA